MIIEYLLGLALIFGPVSDKPETYWATAGTLPGAVLGYSAYAGWVPAETCFNRCVTIPGQRPQLLAGEFSEQTMVDLQLTIWRWDPVAKVNRPVCEHFFYTFLCYPEVTP